MNYFITIAALTSVRALVELPTLKIEEVRRVQIIQVTEIR